MNEKKASAKKSQHRPIGKETGRAHVKDLTKVKSSSKTAINHDHEPLPQQRSANTRKRVKIMLGILTVLALDLAINIINYMIVSFQDRVNHWVLTLIGMTVIAVVLFPAASLQDYINKISEWVIMLTVKVGTLVLNKKKSLYVMFFIILGMLYGGFYWIWFGDWPFQIAAPAEKLMHDVTEMADVEQMKKTIKDLEQIIQEQLPEKGRLHLPGK